MSGARQEGKTVLRTEETEGKIEFALSSRMSAVEDVLSLSKQFLARTGIRDSGPLRIVMRELLINAVEHGNRGGPEKKIICDVEREGSAVKITVEDEGEGFDCESASAAAGDDPRRERKRGYSLIKSLSDKILFEKGGSRVIVYMSAEDSRVCVARSAADGVTVTPAGNITAAVAQEMRELFINLINSSGGRAVSLDFRGVVDIDSIGVSLLIALANSMEETFPAAPRIKILNASSDCRMLMETLSLNRIFDIRG